MSATLKLLYVDSRLYKNKSNFTSASGNVGVFSLRTEDKAIKWLLLISDTAVTTSHFNNWDDTEDLPIGTFLIDQASASPNVHVLTSTDTWQEIGDIT